MDTITIDTLLQKIAASEKPYDTAEALELCTQTGKAKFDETDRKSVV